MDAITDQEIIDELHRRYYYVGSEPPSMTPPATQPTTEAPQTPTSVSDIMQNRNFWLILAAVILLS